MLAASPPLRQTARGRQAQSESLQLSDCHYQPDATEPPLPTAASYRYPHDLLRARQQQRHFSLDDFDVGKRPIGQGKFGTVLRVREKASRRILVMKAISKHAILEEDVKPQLQREIEVHCRLTHPNIVRMYA